jgi:tRNA(Ile2) C34 agmatinyltransferase TiaS
MTDRKAVTVRVSDLKSKAPPQCDACGRTMWWHGSTEGWGCPTPGGDPDCRSSLYRPKRNPSQRWPYDKRYPERGTT